MVHTLLGLINIGSSSAFLAFVFVGVQALALAYAMLIAISLFSGQQEVDNAKWKPGHVLKTAVNILALLWSLSELVLFSVPTALPSSTAMSFFFLLQGCATC